MLFHLYKPGPVCPVAGGILYSSLCALTSSLMALVAFFTSETFGVIVFVIPFPAEFALIVFSVEARSFKLGRIEVTFAPKAEREPIRLSIPPDACSALPLISRTNVSRFAMPDQLPVLFLLIRQRQPTQEVNQLLSLIPLLLFLFNFRLREDVKGFLNVFYLALIKGVVQRH